MAKITDPTNIASYIVDGTPTTEVLQFNTFTRKIKLIEGGGFTFKDGVTGQALFSKIKQVIKASPLLISVPLPVTEMIHDESMELIYDWEFEDANTLKSVRDCGVAYVSTAGMITAKYACFVSLGELAAGTTDSHIYIAQDSATNASTSTFTHINTGTTFGVNELVQIYGDSTHGNFTRTSYAKVFLRRAGYTFDESSNADIGYPALTYKKYNFPITHTVDAGVTVDDTTLAGYTGLAIQWYAAAQSASLGTNGPYNFHVIITGGGKTHDEIYSWVQYQLRQSSDIDADGTGNRTGKVTAALVYMDGATLKTRYQTGIGGVHIASPDSGSNNYIKEYDDTNTLVYYPTSVTVAFEFDSYLQGDEDSYYWIFETADYGTPGAAVLQDANSADMKGAATANTSRPFIHNGTDIPITGIALGLTEAKIATATGTITTGGAKLVFVGGVERWFSDPA